MKTSTKGMSLLVMLGFVLSVLTAFVPAGATSGRAGSFDVNVTFTNGTGPISNSSQWESINVTANVSLAAGMENATDLRVSYSVDDELIDTQNLGELDTGMFAVYTWKLTPFGYGDYKITITAVNGTDIGNQTETTVFFRMLAADVEVQSVTFSPSSALIGVDQVTVTAGIQNIGNLEGKARVMIGLSNTSGAFFDTVVNLAAGATMNVDAVTNFTGMNLTDGTYTAEALAISFWGNSDLVSDTNLTLANPAPHVIIDSLVANPITQFETNNITFTAVLNNTGTADAVNQTVVWWDATGTTPVQIGSTINLTIAKGATLPVTFVWMAPLVEQNTNKTVNATIGTSAMSVNVTVRDEVPLIVFTSFSTTPTTFKIGDLVVFQATVMNNGSGDAIGMTVSFLDGNSTQVTSAAFNLSVGSSKQIALNVTITGTPDANHTFYARESTAGLTRSMTEFVAHNPTPASIVITSFTVKTKTFDKEPKDSSQSNTLTIVLKNNGELQSSNCTLTIMEGKKVVATENILIAGGTSSTKTYTWKVSGSGDHTAIATLTGAESGTPATMSVKCTLNYTPGFEVLFLVAAIGIAAIMVRRRKN